MKNICLIAALFFVLPIQAQYWQQQVDYAIEVSLDDKAKTLDGFERITYYNNSPDTLDFIWFHLWPNAYKNDRTAFSDQMLENGNTAFYFSDAEERGFINRLAFKVNGTTARMEDHPQHIDIIKLLLPEPLLPGSKAEISTPFHVKLPFNFSRGGYDGESFQVTQWYPKPAVYDKNGWNVMPYLDQGEYYSNFGHFDVRITLPSNYVVAATGELQNEEEKVWLKQRADFSWEPVTIKSQKNKNAPVVKTTQHYPSSSAQTKTLHYLQDSVHDFAWFADKRFRVHIDSCVLPSGKMVETYTYYTKQHFTKFWEKGYGFICDALNFYSKEVGEYPYKVASVVHGPESFGGGMEYPTITVLSPVQSEEDLDMLIAHEMGHNWFQGVLASNERAHPWMDEGLNSFYENKYMSSRYGQTANEYELLYLTKAARRTAQAIATHSEDFSSINYGLVAYHRTAAWLRHLENEMGEDTFRSMMQQYFTRWKFRHPMPEDLLGIVYQYTDSTQVKKAIHQVEPPGSDGFQVVSPFKKGTIRQYLQNPNKNILLLAPALGINSYDRLMAGALVTNYKLPPTRFNFLFTPMYATGSKKLAGLMKLNYSLTSSGAIRKTDFFINGSRFSMDMFRDTAGRKLFKRFSKLVPGFRLTFREPDARSMVRKYIQWKTFLFREQSLRIIQDTAITGTDTSLFLRYLLPSGERYLNQLKLVYEDQRALYPYHLNFQIDQARDFLRPSFTATYFFNYKKGGLELRFFAGGFFYLQEKTIRKQFANDRYFLNMSGPKGYEDYTYSDYFFGRNHFEGAESQQIMIRDGAFKVRTDLLANKVGKTDRWLTAINLSSSIPDKINPLSLLPIKIPLKAFLDIGTYAEAWDRNAEQDRFLFDMGLQVSLFDNMLNIYFPLFYSKVYSDYFKSTITKNRFLKTISFSVNLYSPAIKALNRELEF